MGGDTGSRLFGRQESSYPIAALWIRRWVPVRMYPSGLAGNPTSGSSRLSRLQKVSGFWLAVQLI